MLTINEIFKNFKLPLTKERKDLIQHAYLFAEKAHRGQKRRSGEDYIQHCLATAKILGQIGMGAKTVAAGLLHDVPEDTSITLLELEKEFGDEITSMVEGITKLGRIKLRESHEEYFLENLRKMFLAMAADIRVVIIKLADRLHNMQTLEHNPPEKQHRIAMETMEVYVPIANRLGIGEIKSELEDLSFRYLDSENYNYVKNIQERFYKEGEQYINEVIREIKKELDRRGINIIDIHGRAKHLHSLYLKLKRYEMDISRIYDLIAIRIIVPDIADCYETLGIVHEKYRPLIGRIKDYISLPKPNGYQSIHTTIFGPKGRILEAQIRTQKMHNEAEFGIASHWIYKEYEKKKGWRGLFDRKSNTPKESLPWIKQLQEWHQETGSNQEKFLEGLQIDFFKNHIFAFTPLGDVIDLPEEATPIDFAYAIHSEVGNRTSGAKVNGKIVPLDYQIKNGDVVDIMTTKNDKKPNQDWLSFVKTSTAKTQIRKKSKKD